MYLHRKSRADAQWAAAVISMAVTRRRVLRPIFAEIRRILVRTPLALPELRLDTVQGETFDQGGGRKILYETPCAIGNSVNE